MNDILICFGPFFSAQFCRMKDVFFALVGSGPVIYWWCIVVCSLVFVSLVSYACRILSRGAQPRCQSILPHAWGIEFLPLLHFLLADFRNRFRVVCMVVFPSHL